MIIELRMNSRVRDSVEAINAGEVNPIIDLDGVRYLIDTTFWWQGGIRWTLFNLETLEVIGNVSFERHYAAHNRFFELLLGDSNVNRIPLVTDVFPSFPVNDDLGTVIP